MCGSGLLNPVWNYRNRDSKRKSWGGGRVGEFGQGKSIGGSVGMWSRFGISGTRRKMEAEDVSDPRRRKQNSGHILELKVKTG